MSDIPILGLATCGNCAFWRVTQDLTLGACHGTPPTPVVVGMSAQGPAMNLLRPNLVRTEPACALHKRKAVANSIQGLGEARVEGAA